nr:hypothetical protein [Streptomyces sp. ISL-94]
MQQREGGPAQPVVVGGQRAQLQHAHAHPVVPALPVQPAQLHQLVEDPMGGGTRDSGAAYDLGEREPRLRQGLYASGNCSAAVMGEPYPGPGATIGPAMAFGWAAVNAIAAALGRQDSLPS